MEVRMATDTGTPVYTTVMFDRAGKVLEVRNKHGEPVRGQSLGQRKEGDDCPEGQSKIKTIQKIDVEVVTCADTSDPCWYHIACTWYKVC
jgi:hypothetical protein